MILKLNEVYSGFVLKGKRFIEEIKSEAYTLEHVKSGAQLIYIANDDDNKVFSVSFRTPPSDNSGLPHILEHSVLCGSKKFPVKEPFVELLKGSLNTFLNAMTFADKTMYPVASKNDKDFYNLMEVYLDAVFYPNIYENPEVLMQEGWHYDITDCNNPITYKGVVYNEMKGAFSSPDAILDRYSSQSLFPDTPYALESGGDPDEIIKLENEQFLNFHSTYYHPENSYLFLYGDLDICRALQFIDCEYLKDFNRKGELDSSIPMQRAFAKRKEIKVDYPIAREAQTAKKTFLSLNYVIGDNANGELCLAFDILTHLLLTMQGAPLKEAIINAGIGQDVSGVYHSEILQPYLSIGVVNADEKDSEKLLPVVEETLKSLVRKGIDKKKIEAAINSREFALREANFGNYPKGLIHNINIMSTWLHGADPFIHLEYDKYLPAIRASLTSNYFEQLIEQYILNNQHSSLVIVVPRPGMEEDNNAKIKRMLSEYKSSLSKETINSLVDNTQALLQRQSAPDAVEDLQKIKMISITDIKKEAEHLPLEELDCGAAKILLHDIFTNGILYFRMYFDSSAVEENDIYYLYMLAYFLGKMDTGNYSYAQLDNEIDIYTGGISFACEVLSSYNDDKEIQPRFILKGKSLLNNVPQMIKLVDEVINNTIFSDNKRFADLLEEFFARLEMEILENGRNIALTRLLSHVSPLGVYREKNALSLYGFLKAIDYGSDDSRQKIMGKLREVAEAVFNTENLIVSIITEKKEYQKYEGTIHDLLATMPKSGKRQASCELNFKNEKEGLMTAGKVQYVFKGANYADLGHRYSGVLKVVETILRYEYFWLKIRVQGGAYGAFVNFMRNGLMHFGSYRDPNLAETIKVFDETADFVKNFEATEREMTKYIIGTISQMDMPLNAQMKGDQAAIRWLQGRPDEDVQQERIQVLQTTVEDINDTAKMIEEAMNAACLCVYGNSDKIKEESCYFDKIFDIVM